MQTNKELNSCGAVEKKSYVFFTTELKADIENDMLEGYISTGEQDIYNDVVTERCMMDMVKQINSGNVKLDLNHEKFKTGNPLDIAGMSAGKLISAKLDEKGVYVKALLNRAYEKYQDVKHALINKFIDSFSIAYRPIDFAFKSVGEKKIRLLDKVMLLNVALTGTPVNPGATITSVMLKSIQEEELSMVEEIKPVETPAVEAKAVAEAPKAEPKTENFELKSLLEKMTVIEKEIAELKSKKEQKPDTSELDVKLKSLEEGMKKIDEALSKPQFKAVMSNAEAELKAQETQATEKVELKGIVSRIR